MRALLRSLAQRLAPRAPAAADVAVDVVSHHLRLFGVAEAEPAGGRLLQILTAGTNTAAASRRAAADGAVVVALRPEDGFCAAFGAARAQHGGTPPTVFGGVLCRRPARLRSLHPSCRFAHPDGMTVVTDDNGEAAWLWLAIGRGGVLFIGTDLAADLVRYRQGDPAQAANNSDGAAWGFDWERPMYLFEAQLAGEAPHERHADWWAAVLAEFVAERLGVPRRPILPGGAPGAIVLTGDDDQAYLEKYEEQLQLLDGAPITYFLHPQTRHNPGTLRSMLGRPSIDLGLHPDALDAPAEYGRLFADQARWFRELTGAPALSVRNHGFLNDGYWGHLPSWRAAGVRVSSNLPGLDGRVLNGSLLPARVADRSGLTEHWSILTAIGDGVLFVGGMDAEQSAQCVLDAARHIRESGLPGVLVLNVHPQNVTAARGLHRAALATIESGFHPWTLRQCVDWFANVDRGVTGR